MVSCFLLQHAIEFLARQDNGKESISQNAAKLARNHEMVTLMFMGKLFAKGQRPGMRSRIKLLLSIYAALSCNSSDALLLYHAAQ